VGGLELRPGLSAFFAGLDFSRPWRGWGRVAWGMSFDAVKRNYPQATEISGRKLEYRPETDPAGRSYKLVFSFDSGHRLSSLTLSFAGVGETADYAKLVREFARRLGAPQALGADSATWFRDQSQVTVSAKPGGGVVLSETA